MIPNAAEEKKNLKSWINELKEHGLAFGLGVAVGVTGCLSAQRFLEKHLPTNKSKVEKGITTVVEVPHLKQDVNSFESSVFNPKGRNFPLPYAYQEAKEGNLAAQCGVGLYLVETQGINVGLVWLRKAANGGYAEAQYQVACNGYFCILPPEGRAHPVSAAEAMKWVGLAAAQGHSMALWQMGACYENGSAGLQRDINEAVRWYRLAAEKGNGLAVSALEELGYSVPGTEK